jgi:hypothetical protein
MNKAKNRFCSNNAHRSAAIAMCLPALLISAAFGQTAAITPFAWIPTNTAAGVEVVSSPPSGVLVDLDLRCISGSGVAVFATNATTSITVTQSCVVEVIGTQLSSSAGNMVIEARIAGAMIASNRFTVVSTGMLSISAAISAARTVAEADFNIETNAPTFVVMNGSNLVVTFGVNLPADALGPGILASVELDAVSGAVKTVLGGP